MRFLAALLLTWLSLPLSIYALQYKGADFSSMINLENSGLVLKDNGVATKLDTILHNHGANLARIRVWTSTSYSQYSLEYGLAMAKRARAAGMDIYIDLHYSDTWADPGKQGIPAAWPKDLAGLNSQIYTYTLDLVKRFASQGTPIQYIEIGNEINDGMLWPVGRISVNGYSGLSQLLHSASAAVRAGSPSTKIMVHLANGWNGSAMTSFYNQVFLQGALATTDIDALGFSMYPFYDTGATLSGLKSSLTTLANKFKKEIFVVETDWPVVCSGVTLSERGYAISAAGQSQWVAAIRDVVASLPNGLGKGIVYWEPTWIGNANLGSGCADNLLVDSSGNTRTSINMFSASM